MLLGKSKMSIKLKLLDLFDEKYHAPICSNYRYYSNHRTSNYDGIIGKVVYYNQQSLVLIIVQKSWISP